MSKSMITPLAAAVVLREQWLTQNGGGVLDAERRWDHCHKRGIDSVRVGFLDARGAECREATADRVTVELRMIFGLNDGRRTLGVLATAVEWQNQGNEWEP